jgi:uncharacterized protein YjbJ (UPF0337 family)
MGGLEGKGEELKGDIEARVGDATDNADLEAEGYADQASGKAKQAVEDAKDSVRDLDDSDRKY